MKVFTYVIQYNSGAAPNYAGPMVTLAICKPQVRRLARVGDLVLAFSGSLMSPEPHGVVWAGVVSEKLTFAEYWQDRRFATKRPGRCATPDNIYAPDGSDLRQVNNPVHGPLDAGRDLSGRFVLLFGKAWAFGEPHPLLLAEFGLRMVGGRRGHRVTVLDARRAAQLTRWLDQHSDSPAAGGSGARRARCLVPGRRTRKIRRGCRVL